MNFKFTVESILDVTGGMLVYGDPNTVCENFCKNTKEIVKDDVYIGIKGEKFDGSKFFQEAFENGAEGAIINKVDGLDLKHIEGKFLIQVDDTIDAIGKLAKYKREQYNIPVIAVTGSVGKTSTKDIIYSVVAQKYKTLKTQGNMNNHIGLPMTILGLKDHEAIVVEMGMNHFGEISKLTNIAKPTIAVITNVGTAHIGNLGSRENILKAKLEILEGLSKDGHLVINNDNDLLNKWQTENKEYNVVTFGIENDSKYVAKDIEYTENGSSYKLIKDGKEIEKISVPVGGEAFVYNRGYTIINDCYNANYDSMKSAIEFLRNIEGKRKIAVLGDMLELGEFSEKLHADVGKVVAQNNIDILITVGKEATKIAEVARENGVEHVYSFDTNKEAIEQIKKILAVDDVALIKASNSMNFKEIVSALL